MTHKLSGRLHWGTYCILHHVLVSGKMKVTVKLPGLDQSQSLIEKSVWEYAIFFLIKKQIKVNEVIANNTASLSPKWSYISSQNI